MQHILFEDASHFDCYPLTYTRPLWDLRVGITTLAEKWEYLIGDSFGKASFGYLHQRFSKYRAAGPIKAYNAKFIPYAGYFDHLNDALEPNSYLRSADGELLAFQTHLDHIDISVVPVTEHLLQEAGLQRIDFLAVLPPAIRFPWDIFTHNRHALVQDFQQLTADRSSQNIRDPHTIVYGRDNIFVEEGVSIRAAVLNAEDGPIYIGKGVTIQEGAIVHGAHALLDYATVNMGAKLRGDSTVGPWSKVGGEVANSVIQGYSNKGHEGYLGNSVLGQWCNLGADTNTSNLKNNYTEVKAWNYPRNGFRRTGLQFCGLIMGDHSKCGINTMFNTGTVVGVSANIFGSGYPRNFIPSFGWGGPKGITEYKLNKAIETAEIVMARRKIELNTEDREILARVFDQTQQYRR